MKKYFTVVVGWYDEDGEKRTLPFYDVERIDVTSNGRIRIEYWLLNNDIYVRAVSIFDTNEVTIECNFDMHELGRN